MYMRWTSNPNRATNVPVTINYDGGQQVETVNMQNNGGNWVFLGNYPFTSGVSPLLVVSNTGTNGYTVADAVKFEFISN